jgi:rubrerythrin
MANEFNANDIFEIAIKIEQNGAIFYRDAAKQVEKKNTNNFFLNWPGWKTIMKQPLPICKKN